MEVFCIFNVIEDCSRIACFTGHRPHKFRFKYDENNADYFRLMDILDKAILEAINRGYRYFISGLALGVDTWAAELILERRKQYDLKLEAAIPCLNQDRLWREDSKRRYSSILTFADRVTYVNKKEYSPYLMIERDKYMVDRSSLVIAVYDGTPGGTQHTVNYAVLRKKNIYRVSPLDYSLDLNYKNGPK